MGWKFIPGYWVNIIISGITYFVLSPLLRWWRKMIFSSKSVSLCPCVHSHILPLPFHLPVGVIWDWRQQASCARFNLSPLSYCIGVTGRLEQMFFSLPLLNIHFVFPLGVYQSRKKPRGDIRYKGDLEAGRWQDTKEIGSCSAFFGKGQMRLQRSN